ncbi:hypothetical protein K9M42_02205, partial [Patescibacteria group bacterium]|nr:hypothetical protein [Patescibacteria group bacterium]
MFIVNKRFLFILFFLFLFSLNINNVFAIGEEGNICSNNYDCISSCCFWNPENEIASEYYNYAKDCEDATCLNNVYEDYKARLSSIETVCVAFGYCSDDIAEFSETVSSDNEASSDSSYNVTMPDAVSPSSTSEYEYINKMSQSCVIAYDSNCGVFDDGMKDAILNSLTIREAISQNLLHGSWTVGGRCDDVNDKNRCSDKKYTLANIKKMRNARILPSGFEIAANLLKDGCDEDDWALPNHCFNGVEDEDETGIDLGGSCADIPDQYKDSCHYTLNEIVNNYNNEDSELYHLVNPNWILKDVKFRSGISNADDDGGVYGPLLTSTGGSASAYRNTYVPDIESCLKEDNEGKCLAWGYCLREKNVWRFDGDSCEEQYSSCKQYNIVERDGSLSETKYYLADTLDNPDDVCDSSNAGCSLYYYDKENFDYWDTDTKIYLNDNITSCSSSSEGCSSFIRLKDVNYVKDSSFEFNNSQYWDDINSSEDFSIESENPFAGSKYLRIYNGASYESSEIYLTPNKTYTLSYYVKSNVVNNGFYVDIVDDSGGSSYKPTSYDSSFSDFWTRKTYTFSIASDVSYIKLVISSDVASGHADFDAISILDGVYVEETLPDYHTYTDSNKVYYKKAPSYMNCYDSDINNDYILNEGTEDEYNYCNYFMKTCEEMDVGCKKFYKNSSLTGDFIPAKANNNTLCPSECVGYSTYVESSPSYDESGGSTMRNFIASTAVSCSASVSGCAEYIDIDTNAKTYFSDIKQCIKPVDADDNDNFFTYQGSSEEGYKMDVYDLRYFEESESKDLSFGISDCTPSIYQSHYSPDCREFHGLENPDDPEYSLFYANYSDIIHVSESCGYYKISDNISRTVCDSISILPQYVRYGGSESWNGVCVMGIYEEESQSCSASSSGCREYRGTDSASSEIFRDVFEDEDLEDLEDWSADSADSPDVIEKSNESLYLNGHSIKLPFGTSISKDLNDYELNSNGNNNYKLSLYAKSNSFDGSSTFTLNVGDKTIEKTVSNQWTSIIFDPFFNSDIATNSVLTIENDSASSEIYFDFIILRESDYKYLIKNSWVTPVSCDNEYSNPLGYDESSGENGVRNNIGEMLNCSTYYNSSATSYNLKFDSTVLCDVSKVGCEAVFDTYNSSEHASSTFSGEGGYDTSFSVPQDEIKYFVLDSAFSCNSSKEGCSAVGKSKYASSYIILDPDKFLPSQSVLKPILCNEASDGCREFRISSGGTQYYKKPTSEVFYNSYEDIIFTDECEYKENVMVSNSYNGTTYGSTSVSGWFKKDSTLGCSFDSSRDINNPLNYEQRYDGAVGLCNSESVSCTVLTDPTEKVCEGGTVLGMVCNTDQDCGVNADCIKDTVTGNSFCGVSCTEDDDCGDNGTCAEDVCKYVDIGVECSSDDDCSNGTCVDDFCEYVDLEASLAFNKNDMSCRENYDCGFWGVCESINNYTYKNVDDMTACNVASKVDGCMLFEDHSNSNLYWSSDLTYSGSGAPQDSGTLGNFVNDSNRLLQVEKDRECAEWLTFDGNFSPNSEKDFGSDDLGLNTCEEFNSDYSSCKKDGGGYSVPDEDGEDDVDYLYKNKLEGKWSDLEFSGFAIPGYPSIE